MQDKTIKARADWLNKLSIIASGQAAKICPTPPSAAQFRAVLNQIKQAEETCTKSVQQQSIDRLECSELSRNSLYNRNLESAFLDSFLQTVQPNPANHWARLLWLALAILGQSRAVLSGADLQAARPTQTFDELVGATPKSPIQIIQICIDYSPTVLYDLQLLISFYSIQITTKMATFSEIMADKNKLEELKSALRKSEQDHPKPTPKMMEAGYPVQNKTAETIRKKIVKLEQKITANDTF